MLAFFASVVEAYSSEFDVLTVHFDDDGEHYLQLQAIPERDTDADSARVYVEVDDQGIAGADCFSLAELRRGSFRLIFAHEPALVAIGEVVVSFELKCEPFEELRAALTQILAGTSQYRFLEETPD